MKKTTLFIAITLSTISLFAQENWIKYNENPVLSKSNEIIGDRVDWDYFCAADCSVLKDGNTYKMWYTGSGQTETDSIIRVRIGYAYSFDGINWIKYENNPVLEPTLGEWDYVGLETVSVLLDIEAPETERYKMWYAGVYDIETGLYKFGYAYSSDGINWIKYEGNPILEAGQPDSWESGGPEGPTIIKDNGIFKMWYGAVDTVPNGQETDYRSNIGYAWSTDGKNWEKYSDNPVLLTGDWGSWDAAVIQDPFVMKIDEIYYMWYSGFPEWIEGTDLTGVYQIGLAYSSDGITWTKSENNPVLIEGSNGSWDDVLVGFPSIILEDDVLHMYYTGLSDSIIPEFPDPYHWDIGCATSPYTSGIENNLRSNYKIYPNPFNYFTTIKFENLKNKKYTLLLFDITGRCVQTINNITTSYIEIERKNLVSGLYVFQLHTDRQVHATGKLLIE